MAIFKKNTTSILDSLLPTYGNQRLNVPIWNEDDKMFILDEYESQAGHRYYKGIRISDRIAVVETFGWYHSFKYIDSVQVFAFNGTQTTNVGSKKFDKTFYNQELIHEWVEKILRQYISAELKLQQLPGNQEAIDQQIQQFVNESYTSFLSDDYKVNLQQLLPQIENKQALLTVHI